MTPGYSPADGELQNPAWDPPAGKLRVLVPGATGLLGRPLVVELSKRNVAVFSISSKPWEKLHPKVQALFVEHHVHHQALNLADEVEKKPREQELPKVVRDNGFDLVINLAADRGGVKYDGEVKKMNDYRVNVDFVKLLGQITSSTPCRLKEALPMIQVSSEYVWSGEGNTSKGYPALPPPFSQEQEAAKPERGAGPDRSDAKQFFIKEGGPPYAVQKFKSEQYCCAFPNVHVVRVPVLYGDALNALEDGTAGATIDNFLGANSWAHDTWQKRYPTHAGDCAFVLAALAVKCCRDQLNHQVYHYGAQESVSKYQFLEKFATAVGLDASLAKQCDAREASAANGRPRPPADVKLNIDATREELMNAPGGVASNWREPHEMDLLTMFSIWLPFFRDKAAEKRPPDYKPRPELVAELVRCIRRRSRGPFIVIVGGTKFFGEHSEAIVQAAARRLREAFGGLQATIITGGMAGVQETFVNCLTGTNFTVLNLLSLACENSVHVGEDILCGMTLQERMLVTMAVGDVYMTVEGGHGVEREANAAFERGAWVLPIVRTGGKTGGMSNILAAALDRARCPNKEELRIALETDVAVEQTAAAVAELLRRMVDHAIVEHAVASTGQGTSAERAISIFRKFDIDGSGRMAKTFVSKVLSTIMPLLCIRDVEALLQAADPDLEPPTATVNYEKVIRWVFSDEECRAWD